VSVRSLALARLGPSGLRTARRVRHWYRSARRAFMPAVSPGRLLEQLARAGVSRGDALVVHAALARLGNIDGGAAAVVTALIEAVGPDGTLLMPAYVDRDAAVAASAAGRPIDLRVEPGRQGAVAEAFRQWPGVRRSSHPFSSMCAWGARAEFLTGGHDRDPRVCHADSPLARLVDVGGKVLGLGVDMGPVSFYHVAEDARDGFPIDPYDEGTAVSYVDAGGSTVRRTVRAYAPRWSDRRIDAPDRDWMRDAMGRYLDVHGGRRWFTFGAGPAWIITAPSFLSCLQELTRAGVTIYSDPQAWSAVQ